jgi:hypothetical protein
LVREVSKRVSKARHTARHFLARTATLRREALDVVQHENDSLVASPELRELFPHSLYRLERARRVQVQARSDFADDGFDGLGERTARGSGLPSVTRPNFAVRRVGVGPIAMQRARGKPGHDFGFVE